MLFRVLRPRPLAVRAFAVAAPPKFQYQEIFDLAADTKTQYKKLINASKHVSVQVQGGLACAG